MRFLACFVLCIVCLAGAMSLNTSVIDLSPAPLAPLPMEAVQARGQVRNIAPLPEEPEEESWEDKVLVISCVGDILPGGDTKDGSLNAFNNAWQAQSLAASYFLDDFGVLFLSDDITIGSLEGIVTDTLSEVERPEVAKENKQAQEDLRGQGYRMRVPVANLVMLKTGGIDALSVANDHWEDFGPQGQYETIEALKDVGIQSFGWESIATFECEGALIGIVGYNAYEGEEALAELMAGDLPLLKEQYDFLIVSIHWGQGLSESVTQTQQTLGCQAIDLGADLVVGQGAHALQGTEIYKNKRIVYGLGDFLYGAVDRRGAQSMVYRLELTLGRNNTITYLSEKFIPVVLGSETEPYRPFRQNDAQALMTKLDELNALLPIKQGE